MKRPIDEPRVFVIAGGGTGIETCRTLQKKRIPFITGILHENDVDYQVATDLASEVVTERDFHTIADAVYLYALDKLHACDTVINCLSEYGETSARNRALYEAALAKGLKTAENGEKL